MFFSEYLIKFFNNHGQIFSTCYSDQSLIWEVLDKLKLWGNKGVYYEYYKTSDMSEDYELINSSRPIREISEIDDSEVLN